MHEGSPPADEKGAASSLVVVALVGLVLLVGVAGFAWWMLRERSDEPRSAPRSVEPEASAPTPPRATTAREDVDLQARIRAEIERRARPVRVRVTARSTDGSTVEVFTVIVGVDATEDEPAAMPELVGAQNGVCDLPGVTGLVPELAVTVLAEGFAPAHRGRIVLPGRDVELEPFLLTEGVELEGRVTGLDGASIEQLAVVAESASGSIADGRIDATGRFTIEHVDSARVRVSVLGTKERATAVVPDVDVLAGPVTIELEPPSSISGFVTNPAGNFVTARVTATMAGPEERSAGAALTDGPGPFRLESLAKGYYTLKAEKAGYESTVIPRVHTDVTALTIVLRAKATASLELHGAPDGIEVPVIWKPIAVAGVTRRPAAPPSVAWLRDRKLVLRGIPAGTHALELSVPGAMPVVTPAVEFALESTTELGAFTLTVGATLRASVRGADGKPLAARVALAAPHHTAIAGERDVFALPDHLENVGASDGSLEWIALPPGERVFAFRAEGFSDRNMKIAIPESGTLTLDPVTLAPAGSIAGDLRTHAGRPLGAIEITARRIGGPTFSTTTALDGYYEFLRLEPGRYELTVLRVDSGIPADLESALTPKENVTRLVDLAAAETKRFDLTIESD